MAAIRQVEGQPMGEPGNTRSDEDEGRTSEILGSWIDHSKAFNLPMREKPTRLPEDEAKWIEQNRSCRNRREAYTQFLKKFPDSTMSYSQFANACSRRPCADRSSICTASDRQHIYSIVDGLIEKQPKLTEKELYEKVKAAIDPQKYKVPSLSGFSQQIRSRKRERGTQRSYTMIPDEQRKVLKELVQNPNREKSEIWTELKTRFKDETISVEKFDQWWKSGRRHCKPRNVDGRIVKPY